MPDVRPFKGLRYDEARTGTLANVITPPYDVISPTAQNEYYNRSPFNIIRVEFGKEEPADSQQSNKYSRAAAFLKAWIDQGILVPEPAPAFYVYVQEFTFKDRKYRRTGLISAVRLEEWSKGEILPHEETLAKPKADRLSLMLACAANISPVFALYEDNLGTIGRSIEIGIAGSPAVDFVDEFGERHQLWPITDPVVLNILHKEFRTRKLFIADGHHRYETALTYRDEVRRLCPNCGEDEAFNFVLMVLVEAKDSGLLVLPTHRLVSGLESLDLDALEVRIRKNFELSVRPVPEGMEPQGLSELLSVMKKEAGTSQALGMYSPQRSEFWLMTRPIEQSGGNESLSLSGDPLQNLDVTILHDLILEACLGIDSASLKNQSHLRYTRDEMAGVKEALAGECQLVFFLNPGKVQEVMDVALANERMPQKSTYFHPKLPTGLVISKLEGNITVSS